MVVGVNEPGQNGTPTGVDEGGIAGDGIPRNRLGPDGDYAIVLDGNGLCTGLRGVSAPDPAVVDEEIRGHDASLP